MSEWKEVIRNNFFKFEADGDSIEGEYLGTEEGTFGDNHIIQTKEEKYAVGSYTDLNRKLKGVNVGDQVKITYLGEKQSEKNADRTYKDFKVEKK